MCAIGLDVIAPPTNIGAGNILISWSYWGSVMLNITIGKNSENCDHNILQN